jgi:hypothetical protein
MADFKNSFQKGLAAYDAGEQAKAEIRSVLDEAGSQLSDAMDGRIVVLREVLERSPIESLLSSAARYTALVARPKDVPKSDDNMSMLFEFQISSYGYPVKLIFRHQEITCHDREALELGLMKILEHPDTGGRIRRLLASQSASETSNKQPSNDPNPNSSSA